MNLRKYDGKCVRIITCYGEDIEGNCTHNSAEYDEHEFGRYEESLQVMCFLFYKSDIKKIISLEKNNGPYGKFSNKYGMLEEMTVKDGIDLIDEVLCSEDDEHIIRLLSYLEDYINPNSKPDYFKELVLLLEMLIKYNKNEEVIKKAKNVLNKLG